MVRGMSKQADFEAHGLRCVVYLGPVGSLNGYVRVPADHPAAQKDYDDINVDVHGGLTYARKNGPGEKPDGGWWFGFDTAHHGDMVPWVLGLSSGVYRDEAYVRGQCEHLAKQLAAMAP